MPRNERARLDWATDERGRRGYRPAPVRSGRSGTQSKPDLLRAMWSSPPGKSVLRRQLPSGRPMPRATRASSAPPDRHPPRARSVDPVPRVERMAATSPRITASAASPRARTLMWPPPCPVSRAVLAGSTTASSALASVRPRRAREVPACRGTYRARRPAPRRTASLLPIRCTARADKRHSIASAPAYVIDVKVC
jgi:hypothetical protein